jgi:hypothetical protein
LEKIVEPVATLDRESSAEPFAQGSPLRIVEADRNR